MDADIALLQEAAPPPEDVARLRDAALPPAEGAGPLDIGPREAWDSHSWNSDWYEGRLPNLFDRWPMVVKLSDRVEVEWFKQSQSDRLDRRGRDRREWRWDDSGGPRHATRRLD